MKPITEGKISSKLAPDSSHLSASDLHSWEERLSAVVQVTKTESVQLEVTELFNFPSTLVCRVQELKIITNKSQIAPRTVLRGKEK